MAGERLRALRLGVTGVAPYLAGLFVIGGWPWRPDPVDLEVYRLAGEYLVTGRDFYRLPGELPFIYPPIAALLAVVPWALPTLLVHLLWTALNTACVVLVVRRCGIGGWALPLVATLAILLLQPVRFTFVLGQLGLVLCALVVADLFRASAGDRLPRWAGWRVGIAAGLKLTPAVVVPHLLLTRQFRPAIIAMGSFLAVTTIGFAVLPGPSLDFWGGLVRGDTGLGDTIIYTDNQSVMGSWLRLTGGGSRAVGLALSAVVAVVGIAAAVVWTRRGEHAWAVCLAAFGGLAASPVSWSHHYVWVLPLLVLAVRRRLPAVVVVITGVLGAWVATAPWRLLPMGDYRELGYGPWDNAIASLTVVLVASLLVASLVTGLRGHPASAFTQQPRAVVG